MLKLFQDWLGDTGAPGVSVAIDDGSKIRCFGAGVADLVTATPVCEAIAFQFGSVSKTITAFLLAEALFERGIELDTPVVAVAPDLAASNDYAFHDVTVRHLLNHTGGLDSQWWVDVGQGGNARRAAARAIAAQPLIARPGELFSYSNSGYVLAGYLTEILTGQGWEEYGEARISRSLGTHSISARPERILTQPVAAGYGAPPSGEGGGHRATRWYAPAALAPGGGLAGTPGDLARLMRIVRERMGPGPSAAVVPTIGWRHAGWGTGMARYRLDETSFCWGHDGTTSGQACAVRLLEGRPETVVVAANAAWAASRIGMLAEDILRKELGIADAPPPAALSDPLSDYADWHHAADADVSGRYVRLNATMTVSADPDGIVVEEIYSPQDAMNWFGAEARGEISPTRERMGRAAPHSYASAGRELHFLRHPEEPARAYVHDGMRASLKVNRPWL